MYLCCLVPGALFTLKETRTQKILVTCPRLQTWHTHQMGKNKTRNQVCVTAKQTRTALLSVLLCTCEDTPTGAVAGGWGRGAAGVVRVQAKSTVNPTFVLEPSVQTSIILASVNPSKSRPQLNYGKPGTL